MSLKRPSKRENDDLNNQLIDSFATGADLVKHLYSEAEYVKFRYEGNDKATCIQLSVIVSFFQLGLVVIMCTLFPKAGIPWFGWLLSIIALILFELWKFFMWYSSLRYRWYDGVLFRRKTHPILIFQPIWGKKGEIIVVFNQNKKFQLKSGEFIDVTETNKYNFITSKLMFDYFFKYSEFKKGRNCLILRSKNQDRNSTMIIKNGKPVKIVSGLNLPSSATPLETMRINEYNGGNDVLELPESFKALCEQEGVKPLENEHIRYV